MAPLLMLGLSVLPGLAKLVAGDRTGAITGAITDAVRDVVGTEDPAAAQAALHADPNLANDLRIRMVDAAMQVTIARIQADLAAAQAGLADVADARARDLALRERGIRRWMPGILLGLAALGVLFFGSLLVFGGMEEGKAAQAAVIAFASQCLGMVVLAANFEWGSSFGSRSKDDERRGGGGAHQPPFDMRRG